MKGSNSSVSLERETEITCLGYRLVGLVVKAYALEAADPV